MSDKDVRILKLAVLTCIFGFFLRVVLHLDPFTLSGFLIYALCGAVIGLLV